MSGSDSVKPAHPGVRFTCDDSVLFPGWEGTRAHRRKDVVRVYRREGAGFSRAVELTRVFTD